MKELTITEAQDLFGKIGSYDFRRFSNGRYEKVKCEVEIVGIDKHSNILVQVVSSEPFKIKYPSLTLN